ncbi:MAG: SCO family protein [Thermomicrobiales bacterium]
MKRTWLYVIAGVALILLAGSLVVPRLLSAGETYNGTIVDAEGSPEEFQLESANGPVNLSDYRGELVVMYFGYTNCPDFCPATLSKLTKVREQLGDDADDVQVLMISVDPERDSPERLGQYMASFDPNFVGLTGTEDQIRAVATQFGIFFQKSQGSDASGYLVDHTTTLVVVDRDGHQRLYLPYDLTVDQVTNDLGNLL